MILFGRLILFGKTHAPRESRKGRTASWPAVILPMHGPGDGISGVWVRLGSRAGHAVVAPR